MKLYLLTTGLGDFYVVAQSMNEAEDRLKELLDIADYGYYQKRKVENVRIIDEELTEFPEGKPNFSSGKRLVLPTTLPTVTLDKHQPHDRRR